MIHTYLHEYVANVCLYIRLVADTAIGLYGAHHSQGVGVGDANPLLDHRSVPCSSYNIPGYST